MSNLEHPTSLVSHRLLHFFTRVHSHWADYAQKTLFVGSLLVIAIIVGLPFLPESFPSMVIPLAYSKKQIEDAESYSFQSAWKVLGSGALTLLLFVAAVVFVLLTLEPFGIISLA